MAHILSTGARNAVAETGSVREAFSNMYLDVYTGAAPDTADKAATGTKLVRVSIGSAAASDGVMQVDHVVITAGAEADYFTCTINGVECRATQDADDTADDLATKMATAINASTEKNNVMAIAFYGAAFTEAGVIIWSRVPGLAFTDVVAKNSSGGTITKTAAVANTRGTGLLWDEAATGVVSKPSGDTWSGVALADGTAGYYRFVKSTDTAVLSTTEVRLQGNCSVSGSELNLAGSTTIAASAPVSVSSFSLTVKLSV